MSRTILIAEDNPELLEVLATQFDWRGFRVLRARDGVEALQLLEREPDLLLLDVAMPRKTGFEVCRFLKSDPARRDLPVILFSGRKGKMDREWGLDCGADAYVTKPFGISELEAEVIRLLSLREIGGGEPAARPAAGERVCVRWVLDAGAARVYRQKYGELAWRRVLRELPDRLLHRLSSWGVEGCALLDDYGAVSLEIPGPRRRVEVCLPRLTEIANAFLRSCYDAADAERGSLALGGGREGEERLFPLLRIEPRIVDGQGGHE